MSWDLTSLVGKTLGLQFELNALFSDLELTSTATVSNVQTNRAPVVPLPAAGWAGLALLLGLGATRKLRRKQ